MDDSALRQASVLAQVQQGQPSSNSSRGVKTFECSWGVPVHRFGQGFQQVSRLGMLGMLCSVKSAIPCDSAQAVTDQSEAETSGLLHPALPGGVADVATSE